MSKYSPHCWQILKCTKGGAVVWYKVFGGWHGGFVGGDSWKLNSGISAYTKTEWAISFSGHSGSVYECAPGTEGTVGSWLTNVMLNLIASGSEAGYVIEQISFEDFEKEFVE